MSKKIMLFGEIVWDVIEGEEYIGGAPFNVAVHLSRLGSDVSFVSRVGDDIRGEEAVKTAGKLGVDTSGIQTDSHNQTGVAYCKLLEDGSAVYEFPENIAYNFIDSPGCADGYDTFYFGTLVQMGDVTRKTLHEILDNHSFENVVLDVNIRRNFYPRDVIEYSFSKATVVKMNNEESVLLSELLYGNYSSDETFAGKIAEDYGIKTVIITKGAEGYGLYDNGEYAEYPVKPAVVCDTIGAGDAFAGGFIHYFTDMGDARFACEKGGVLGTFVASCKSAVPEYSEELKNNLELSDNG